LLDSARELLSMTVEPSMLATMHTPSHGLSAGLGRWTP